MAHSIPFRCQQDRGENQPAGAAVRATHPEDLTQEQRGVLAEYWRGRGVGEMGAERYFARIVSDLRALGAAQSLIDCAIAATGDERRHGLWGRDWAVFFGHTDASDPLAIRTKELMFPGASARENGILRIAFCALLETVGCHTLAAVRPRIGYGPLLENNRVHLSDEVRHARVGWAFLSTLNASDRHVVSRFLPLLLRLLPKAVCEGSESDQYDALVPFGYLTPSILRQSHAEAVREVIEPGLEHVGISLLTQRGAA